MMAFENQHEGKAGRLRNISLFLAMLITTVVLGYPVDVGGFVTWFLARPPLATAYSWRGH